LGLTRIGVVVALVNHNLSGEPLAHSIGIVRPKVVIVGADLAHRLVEIRARLAPDIACRVLVSSPVGSSPVDLPPIALELDAVTQEPWSGSSPAAPSLEDTALYIYTSGTTGLPKAARNGAIGSPACSIPARTTGCSIVCRFITVSAAWSRHSRRW
jgi:acyl-coenzyme A synthetase/AMP-(fatty) acid ligase